MQSSVLKRAWLKFREASGDWTTKTFRLLQRDGVVVLEIAPLRFPDSPELVVDAGDFESVSRWSEHGGELGAHEFGFDVRCKRAGLLSIGASSQPSRDEWIEALAAAAPHVGVEEAPAAAEPAAAAPAESASSSLSGKSRVRSSRPKVVVHIWNCDARLFSQLTAAGVPDELAAYALAQTGNAGEAAARHYLDRHPELIDMVDVELRYDEPSPAASTTTTTTTTTRSLKTTIGGDIDDSEEYLVGSGSELDYSDGGGDDDDDDDDDDGSGYFEPVDLHSSTGNVRRGRNTLTASGIDIARQSAVLGLAGRLQVPEWFATALLHAHLWDGDKAAERYLADADGVQKELGIDLVQQEINEHQTITCSICWEESSSNAYLPCGHSFCQACFVGQIESGLNEGKSVDIDCLAQRCVCLIPEYLVQKLAPPALYARYASFANNAFVSKQKRMKWCPRAGCSNAVYDPIQERNCLAGYCACGFRFCFSCAREAHSPVHCDVMNDWQRKLDQDAATLMWIQENTKPCPQCGTGIQKNDGCFMMTCATCKAQWCWLCQKPWSTHPNHFRCNTYDESTISNTVEYRDGGKPAATNTKELSNFVSVLELYNEHNKSSQFEQTLRDSLRAKIEAVRGDNTRVFDTEFLPAAHAQLAQLRSVLKFSFVETWHIKNQLADAEQSNASADKIEQINTQLLLRQLQQDQLGSLAETFTRVLGDQELFNTLDSAKAAQIRDLTRSAKQQVQNFLMPL